MTTIGPVAIVDLITDDLETNATLPAARTVRRYAEPTLVAESCPMLAVWTEETDYTLLTGAEGLEAYDRRHIVTVSYYVTGGGGMADTGGTMDQATLQTLEATAGELEAILTGYASGIPTTNGQAVATIRSAKLEPQSGSVWRCAFQLTVDQAA